MSPSVVNQRNHRLGSIQTLLASGWYKVSSVIYHPPPGSPIATESDDLFHRQHQRQEPSIEYRSLVNVELPEDLLNDCFATIQALAEQAGLCPVIQRVFQPKKRRFSFFPARRDSGFKKLEAILDALITYTKAEQFVNLFSISPELPNLIDLIWHLSTLSFLVNQAATDTTDNDEDERATVTRDDVDPFLTSPQPPKTSPVVIDDPSRALAASLESVNDPIQTVFDSAQTCDNGSHHTRSFLLSFKLATVLANMSSRMASANLLTSSPVVSALLSSWINSDSLRLILLGEKVAHNLRVNCSASSSQTSPTSNDPSPPFRPIYHTSIYRLDDASTPLDPNGYDIIFVNGMLGSVFYTWRQQEATTCSSSKQSTSQYYTKCWPRDWLAKEFPGVRVLGVDTPLKPFLWNALCPIDQSRRELNKRAHELLQQLLAAEVGRRPIIWVTHSAGGILIKEVIRMASTYKPTNFINDSTTSSTSDNDEGVSRHFRISSSFCTQTSACFESCLTTNNDTTESSSSSVKYMRRHISTALSTNRQGDGRHQQSSTSPHCLASQSKAVIFMSTPHRGSVNLFALFQYPLKWLLTPEALPFEPGSPYLLDLHDWFGQWASDNNLQIMSMVETRLTKIVRFLSLIIVPEDDLDNQLGKLVRIDADHLYISKPNSPLDQSYKCIVDFIHELVDDDDDDDGKNTKHPTISNNTVICVNGRQ